MLLRRTPRRNNRLKPLRVRCSNLDLDTRSHAASSHGINAMGIPQADSFVPINPLVWAGYDPQESENGDNAALVIAAPPLIEGGQFRIFERHQLRGLDFEQQAEFIEAILSRYNCSYLGVDAKGVGAGVYQLLAKSKKLAGCSVAKIEYSLEIKAQMIMKAQNVIRRGRLAFDSGMLDIVSAFVSIKKTLTTSGRNITFKAGRGGTDGHADLAWAAMHVLMNEPLDGKEQPKGTMEIIE